MFTILTVDTIGLKLIRLETSITVYFRLFTFSPFLDFFYRDFGD